MKKDILSSLLLVGVVTSPSSSAVDQTLVSPEGRTPNVESMTIATFALSGGGEARFLVDHETGEIGYYEAGSLDRRRPYFEGELGLSPLERFVRLAPDDVAVPRAIVENADQPIRQRLHIASRRTVEQLPRVITAKPDNQTTHNDQFACWTNDTPAKFAAEYCHSSGGGSRVELCHSGHWHAKTTEHHKRNRIYSVAVYCSHQPGGGGYGRIVHERRKNGVFYISYYGLPIYHNTYRWVDWGGKRHGRRATFRSSSLPSPDNSYEGYTRSYSVLYND